MQSRSPPSVLTDRPGGARSPRARIGRAAALIDSIVAGLPRPDPRAVARLADAVGGRAADEAYRGFHRELYDWLVTYARDVEPGSLRVEEIGELWDRIRDARA